MERAVLKTPLNTVLFTDSNSIFASLGHKTKIFVLGLLVFFTASCSSLVKTDGTELHNASHYYNYLQPTYEDYLKVTEDWLTNHRRFISDTPEKELAMNMPFELGDKSTVDKAILLVHGLGDSPYSFSDIAKTLQKQGFYVQTLLLPGHGSKPQDLGLANYSGWQKVVDHYASLLKHEFKQVWLGGYSTGGNLVTIHAINHSDVEGLMLFSPGFQSNIPVIEKFAPVVSLFIDGYEREETNLVKILIGLDSRSYRLYRQCVDTEKIAQSAFSNGSDPCGDK